MVPEGYLERSCSEWFGNIGHELAFKPKQTRFRLAFIADGYQARVFRSTLSEISTIFPDKTDGISTMQSIEDKVINRVYGNGRGWAFFRNDFSVLGSPEPVAQAFMATLNSVNYCSN